MNLACANGQRGTSCRRIWQTVDKARNVCNVKCLVNRFGQAFQDWECYNPCLRQNAHILIFSFSLFFFLSFLFKSNFFSLTWPLLLFFVNHFKPLYLLCCFFPSPGVAASSFFTSGKYAIDPELRGAEFERLTQNLDVHFWKMFWSITETEVLSVSRLFWPHHAFCHHSPIT